ncbi:hypothetical protein Tco_0964785 [Tanacetum coccineum]
MVVGHRNNNPPPWLWCPQTNAPFAAGNPNKTHPLMRAWRGRVHGDDNDIDGSGWLAEVATRRWGGGRLWLPEGGRGATARGGE